MKKYPFKNLDEVLTWLSTTVSNEDKDNARYMNPASFHHTTGQFLRNTLGLWDENSTLHQWFKSIGIWHADDMSGIILESFKRKLNNQDIKLAEQVKHYQDFWDKTGDQKNLMITVDKKTKKIKILTGFEKWWNEKKQFFTCNNNVKSIVEDAWLDGHEQGMKDNDE